MGNLRKKRRRKIAQHKRKKLLKAMRHKNKYAVIPLCLSPGGRPGRMERAPGARTALQARFLFSANI